MKRTIISGFLFLISILFSQSIAGDFKYKVYNSTISIKPKFLNSDPKNMKDISIDIRKQDRSFILDLNALYREVLSPKQLDELNKTRYTLIFYLNPKTGQIFYCSFNCRKADRNLIGERQLRKISDGVLKTRYDPSCLWYPEKEDKNNKTIFFSTISIPLKILPLPK